MAKAILIKEYQVEAVEFLKKEYELVIAEKNPLNLADLGEQHPETEALISFLSDRIDRPLMGRLPSLKIIANYAVGYNNIDYAHAIQKKIYVTHTPDILTSATALRAKGFGLKIIYFYRLRRNDLEKKHGLAYKSFVELVKTADVVSLHIPYSPDLHHLFNRDVFALMKRDAIFINAARGPLMAEDDLAEALARNEFFGAGLDVYENEPQVNAKLKSLPNVVLAPHIGSATHQTRLGMAMMTVASVKEALAGNIPPHLIPEWRQALEVSETK